MASTNGLGVQRNCPAWFVLGLRWSPYPAISQTTNQKIIGPQVSWDHAQAKEDIHLILWTDALYKQERPTTLSIYFRCLELEEVAIETGYKSCKVCMHALSETFQEQHEFTSSDLWTIFMTENMQNAICLATYFVTYFTVWGKNFHCPT